MPLIKTKAKVSQRKIVELATCFSFCNYIVVVVVVVVVVITIHIET